MMDLSHIHKLHYITHIDTISSILEKGILSYNQASANQHQSVSSPIIQQRRKDKQIPGGTRLPFYLLIKTFYWWTM